MVSEATLCTTCASVVEGTGTPLYSRDPNDDNYLPFGRKYMHHIRLCDLIAAVQSGCTICCMLWDESTLNDTDVTQFLKNENNTSKPAFMKCTLTATEGQDRDDFQQLTLELERSFVSQVRDEVDIVLTPEITLTFVPQDPEHISVQHQAHDTTITSTTGDYSALALARTWVDECQRFSHPECHDTESPAWMPLRLLELRHDRGNGSCFRLMNTSEEAISSSYATVSYCWGNADFLHLQTDNIEQLHAWTSAAHLPLAFREAIVVCHSLEIRYLWIDSLCIVQNDLKDWFEQAQQMSRIYANSACTIAADASSNPHEGLFRTRLRTPECCLVIITNPKWPEPEDGLRTGRYALVNYFLWIYNLEVAALNQRAWVFQERLLSPRILHFTKDQILWECRAISASESYKSAIPPSAICQSSFKASAFHMASANHQTDWTHFGTYWGNVVQKYTCLTLSNPHDRPLAILGIVERSKGTNDDEYISGMWKSDLCVQLCWTIAIDSQGPTERLPTFSWLGFDRPVEMPYPQGQLLCNLEDATVSELIVTPEGCRQTGHIVLRGMLKRMMFKFAIHSKTEANQRNDEYDKPPWDLVDPESTTSTSELADERPWVQLDVINDQDFSAHIAPMFCDGAIMHCLILAECDGYKESYFCRLGVCLVLHSGRDDLEKQPNPLKDMGLAFWEDNFMEQVEANRSTFTLI